MNARDLRSEGGVPAGYLPAPCEPPCCDAAWNFNTSMPASKASRTLTAQAILGTVLLRHCGLRDQIEMADVQFNSMQVRQAALGGGQREKQYLDGVSGVVDILADTASILAQAGDDNKVAELRNAVIKLLQMKQQVAHHVEALREVHGSYEMSGEATDFQALLSRRVEQLAAEQPYQPTHDELYQAFQDAVGGAAEGEAEEQIDEDIAIEGGPQLARNDRCPITGKALLDLEEPVTDAVGFVYEKAGILQLMRNHGQAKCPVAGTSHVVLLRDLKPATRVVRAQQRARRGGGARHHQTQGHGEDALDVE